MLGELRHNRDGGDPVIFFLDGKSFLYCHPPTAYTGLPTLNQSHWVPAFAGMTELINSSQPRRGDGGVGQPRIPAEKPVHGFVNAYLRWCGATAPRCPPRFGSIIWNAI